WSRPGSVRRSQGGRRAGRGPPLVAPAEPAAARNQLGLMRGVSVYLGHDVLGPRRAAAPRSPLASSTDVETGGQRRSGGRSGTADAARLYLRQIAHSTLLTPDCEAALARQVERDGQDVAVQALPSAL